jgi:hypothetical protein
MSDASSLSLDWLPIQRRCSAVRVAAVFGLWSLNAMMRATTSCQVIVCMSWSGMLRR